MDMFACQSYANVVVWKSSGLSFEFVMRKKLGWIWKQKVNTWVGHAEEYYAHPNVEWSQMVTFSD